jgi:hypothetical protein
MSVFRNPPALHTGDVVACWGSDWFSRLISAMTCSPLPPWGLGWAPSHVAIIHREPDAEPIWYESTTLAPGHAAYGKPPVYGVQEHRPADRWNDYRGRCVVYRPSVKLTTAQKKQMGVELRRFAAGHIPYDVAGALLSGTWFLRHLVPASRSRMFCSELIATVLQRARLMNWGSPSGYSPGRLLRELVKAGAFEPVLERVR